MKLLHSKYELQQRYDFTASEIDEMQRTFRQFDSNGDGDIDLSELREVMKLIHRDVDDEKLKKMMAIGDSDGDDKMSFQEFVALVHRCKENPSENELLDAIKRAGQIKIPSMYARIQTFRTAFQSPALTPSVEEPVDSEDPTVIFAVRASWVVNVFLLGIKIVCYYISGSKSVLAALADSVVDLVSQVILAVGDYYANKPSPKYPIGRSRIEALSVLACAAVMIVASVEVVQEGAVEIYDGATGILPVIPPGIIVYVILGVGVLMKQILFLYCKAANRGPDGKEKSDMLSALAEDHLNDVFSNVAAMGTMAVSQNTIAWWVDPAGCIVISLVIVHRWLDIMRDQMEKVVGDTASPEFIEMIKELVLKSDLDPIPDLLGVDRVIAYHSGSKYNVEVELLLSRHLTVDVAHDIGLKIQQRIENLPDVERANIHIDFQSRDIPEHKVEKDLAAKCKSQVVMSPFVSEQLDKIV